MDHRKKQQFSSTIMNVITLSVATIIGIALVSIFISFWVTEQIDQNAQAINEIDSIRMQTYRIGLAFERSQYKKVSQYISLLHNSWHHSTFSKQHSQILNQQTSAKTTIPSNNSNSFMLAYNHWNSRLKPALKKAEKPMPSENKTHSNLSSLLNDQVSLTDAAVNQLHKNAQRKVIQLRSFQLIALLITIIVGSLIFYILKNRVEKPLLQLTQAAKKIGMGDFKRQVDIKGNDEFSLLGATFNQMTASIANSYNELEEQVNIRTQELKQNNTALDFLFHTAHKILNSKHNEKLDLQTIIDDLSKIIQQEDLEICLFTKEGNQPYLQLMANPLLNNPCGKQSCDNCKIDSHEQPLKLIEEQKKFPIAIEERYYGILSLNPEAQFSLLPWQENLIQSVADQLGIALSLTEQKDQDYRYAMLSERTVIARELHDSLAQALSYLQIQVMRLQKTRDMQKFDLQQPIIDELREGLSSAYRQLRELLTTFRLKIDAGGLHAALQNTVAELQERSQMTIALDYQVTNLPLNPAEEIHLLQIVREATQNAIHHSQGKNVIIRLQELDNKSVLLEVEDDGIGITEAPEKLNHYGLAIMNERSRSLGGSVNVHLRKEGGTRVACTFVPSIDKT